MSDHSGYLQTQGDHVAFVRSICLAEPKYSLTSNYGHRVRPGHREDDKAEGYIVSGSVAAFTRSVSGPNKQDVLDATLFAQQACDEKHDPEGEVIEWYKFYNHILGNLGFIVEDVEFRQYEISGATFKMDEAVLEIIAAVATEGETAILTSTLNVMRAKARNELEIAMFDIYGSKNDLGNFQVLTCTQSPSGEVSLAMGAFSFTMVRDQVNFLFFSWERDHIEFQSAVQTAVFNTNVYDRVRQAIANKLGHHALHVVASIRL